MMKQLSAAKKVYCACKACTAKWFCDAPTATCPRCGSDQVSRTRATPPWLNERSTQERRLGNGADNEHERASGASASEIA